MKKSLPVVLAFIVLSVGLTWAWNEWLRVLYGEFFATVAPPIYDALGFGDARVVTRRLRYINFVPFVALVLVTPGLALPRRLIGLAAGLVTIAVSHLVLNLTAHLQPGPALPIVSILISDAFPFFVWIVVAYPALARFLPGARELDVTVGESKDEGRDDGRS
jgi:hypothetical protein